MSGRRWQRAVIVVARGVMTWRLTSAAVSSGVFTSVRSPAAISSRAVRTRSDSWRTPCMCSARRHAEIERTLQVIIAHHTHISFLPTRPTNQGGP